MLSYLLNQLIRKYKNNNYIYNFKKKDFEKTDISAENFNWKLPIK